MTADPGVEAKRTSLIEESMSSCRTLGIGAVAFEADELRLRLPWSPELCPSNGVLHGGMLKAVLRPRN